MRALFSTVLRWLQWGIGIVPASARRPSVLFPILHYSAVVLITVLLAWFSDEILPTGWRPDPQRLGWLIARCWCGVLFLLVYVFGRLVIYLITLLFTPEELEFSDIWDAWSAGLQGLSDQRLDLRWLPVFLINGMTREEEQRFFQSVRMNWRVVAPDSTRQSSPLRFYANEEAVCISCTNVGAVAAQHGNYEARTVVRGGPILKQMVPEREPSHMGTLAPSQGGQRSSRVSGGLQGTLQHTPADDPSDLEGEGAQEAVGGTLGGTLRRTLSRAVGFSRTLTPGAPRSAEKPEPAGLVVPLTAKQMEVSRRRMRFLCTLLMRERQPWCPLNGMLQAAPLAWSDPSAAMSRISADLSRSVAADVETVCKSLEVQFPLTFVLTGFDRMDGFQEFLERTKKETGFRDSRAGSRYPIGRPIQSETAAWIVSRVLHWLKGWVYKVFADDLDSPANRKIYYLLCTLRRRQERLQVQVERSLAMPAKAAEWSFVRLSGVYFGAMGEGTTRGVFGRGLLQRLIEDQDAVAWAPALVRRDRVAKTAATVLFVLSAGVALLDAWLAWQIYKK